MCSAEEIFLMDMRTFTGDIYGQLNERQKCDVNDFLSNGYKSICGKLEFKNHIAENIRMRYLSETLNNSCSSLKAINNETPILKIDKYTENLILHIKLIALDDSDHFFELYEISAKKKYEVHKQTDGSFIVLVNNHKEIELDFLGIAKPKAIDAKRTLRDKYKDKQDGEINRFYNANKDCVRIQFALRSNEDLEEYIITTKRIYSASKSEYTKVMIEYIAPKCIHGQENLIVVLNKKVTKETESYLIYNQTKDKMEPIYSDSKVFVFQLPPYKCDMETHGEFQIKCEDNFNSVPLTFFPYESDKRKRKSGFTEEAIINKKPLTSFGNPNNNNQGFYQSTFMNSSYKNQHNNVQIPQVESRIEFDYSINDYDGSSYDSGISKRSIFNLKDSNNQSVKEITKSSQESSSLDSSETESDNNSDEDQNEDEDIDGLHKRSAKNNVKPIYINRTYKYESKVDNILQNVDSLKQILSEVSRIGHDYAFGKTSLEIMDRLEHQLPLIFTLQDDVGDTPLNNAILQGNESNAMHILKIVTTHCKWALNIRNTSGHTALILAPTCSVSEKFVRCLLDSGCVLNCWDDMEKSPLDYAIEYNKIELVNLFLDHVENNLSLINVLQRRKGYYTPLQNAIINKNVEIVNLLLSCTKIDVNETSLMNEQTALHLAINLNADINIIDRILNHPDVDINSTNGSDLTPLDLAISKNNMSVISRLVAKGAHSIENFSVASLDNKNTYASESIVDDLESKSSSGFQTPLPQETASSPSEQLTEKLANLSIQGPIKEMVLSILTNSTEGLTRDEAVKIIKKTFEPVFNSNSNCTIKEIFNKFNCLPPKLGMLIEKLQNINRNDLSEKIQKFV